MRGIPKCVEQDEVKKKKNQLAVCCTVNAAVLKGDHDYPTNVDSRLCNTKHVPYLSMVSSELK